jgi:RNA 3'-terminal phosphate cyclase
VGRPVYIRDIRLKRRTPGLKRQQLGGLEFLAKISGGLLRDGLLGSLKVMFKPGDMGVIGNNFLLKQSTGSVKMPSLIADPSS